MTNITLFGKSAHLFRHTAKQHSLGILGTVVFIKRRFYNLGVIVMPKQTVSHLQCCSRTILCTVVRYSSTPLIA